MEKRKVNTLNDKKNITEYAKNHLNPSPQLLETCPVPQKSGTYSRYERKGGYVIAPLPSHHSGCVQAVSSRSKKLGGSLSLVPRAEGY